MFKRFFLLLLEFGAGLAGNLVAGYIQQDAWQNLFTTPRLIGTGIGAAAMLLFLAWVESEQSGAWNWRWHRFWYLRALMREFKRWETEFAQLGLAPTQRGKLGSAVVVDGNRRDLVEHLLAVVSGPPGYGRKALVLGEPGAGKTTGLERLAWELARRGARRWGWGSALPVLLRLGSHQRAGDLTAFAQDAVQKIMPGRSGVILSRVLPDLLTKGRVVLLCDALDEALLRRDAVLADLDPWVKGAGYDRLALVLTARTRDEPGGRWPELPVYTIQDLTDEAVRLFIGGTPDDVWERLQRANLLASGGMGRNPFWLRLIVSTGVFQGGKGQILSDAVEALLKREWEKPHTGRTGWERRLPEEQQLTTTRDGLAWLAHEMSLRGTVELADGVAERWLHGWNGREALTAGDLIGLGRDAQVLVYQPGPLRFRHRLLQEALTAHHLSRHPALAQEALTERGGQTGWWETFLMLGHLAPGEIDALVTAALGDGADDARLMLAAGLLQGSGAAAQEATRAQVAAVVGANLARGDRPALREALRELAESAPEETAALLQGWLRTGDAAQQRTVVRLLAGLGGAALRSGMLTLAELGGEALRNGVTVLAEVGGEALRSGMTVLAELGGEALRSGMTVLAELGENVLRDTLRALPQESRPAIADALLPWLRQTDVDIRRALTSLSALGDGWVIRALATLPIGERAVAGDVLARVGDTRPGVGVDPRSGLPDIAWGGEVPVGQYVIGRKQPKYPDEQERTAAIRYPYRLARYPVTYVQFQCFLKATDRDDARWWAGMPHDARRFYDQAFPVANHPRDRVSWYQAVAFCRWLEYHLRAAGAIGANQQVLLPHEDEWEVAARYAGAGRVDDRAYPWGGNAITPEHANYDDTGIGQTTAVGLFPAGRQPHLDLDDLSGNVWEWCRNKYRDLADDGVDESGAHRTLRGGSWNKPSDGARASYRGNPHPNPRINDRGFRVVCVVRPPSHQPPTGR